MHGQLMGVLREHSAEPMRAEGEKFNPEEHEAVGEREVGDPEKDGTVVAEARKGYRMKGKVLRPAQVIVGRYERKGEKINQATK